ncbi:MAG: uroporphyrinogen decarboxylase family protein [Phycisphaerae bacterium]|jgi:uroporphyrinogen decarboxylase
MDSQTRFLMALKHQKPDRPPFNFWMDRRLMAQYEACIGHRHWRVTRYGADVIETFADLRFPVGTQIEQDGTAWQTDSCLKSWDQAEALCLPDPGKEEVYAAIQADLAEFPDKAVILDMPTPLGVIAGMRTYETLYTDLYDHPEEYKALGCRVAEIQAAAVERACKMGITALYMMEDIATAHGLAMSPAMIQEFCLDLSRKQIDTARAHGVPVMFHSDGAMMDFVPMVRAMGGVAVNPLQPHLNNARQFKATWGGRMAVYGGLDNCFIIPDGTAAEVRRHVLDVFDVLGRPDGGLILSTHDIPLHTPPENVETLIDTIKNECRY